MYAAIGMFLRGTRLSHNLTQLAVAKRLKVKAVQISSYELGRTKVPLLLFCQWCQVLNLDPGETLNRAYGAMVRRSS